jgi:ribonuclease P protein component
VQRGGRRRHTPHFVVVSLESDRAGAPARLGITVSSRVGGSVQRNRVKRRVRELFRLRRGEFIPGQDVVVIAKTDAPEISSAETVAELMPAFGALSGTAEGRC